MNTVTWLIGGAAVAWLACRVLHLNMQRGMPLLIVIGAVAGFFGGSVVAPTFANAASAGDGFSPLAFALACISALLFSYLSDWVYERFGV